jgi:hypothetical protein
VANEVSVDLVLKTTTDKAAFDKVETESKKAGEKSGDSFSKSFTEKVSDSLKLSEATFTKAIEGSRKAGLLAASGFNQGIKSKMQETVSSTKEVLGAVKQESAKAGKDAGSSFGLNFNRNIDDQLSKFAKFSFGAAIAGIATLGFALKKGVDEAISQEEAIKRLNFALQSTGQFSTQTSQDFQNFASQLQRTTKFADDAVLSSAGLIQQLVSLDVNGLKRATQASADFASFLGTDLESAASLVAKALEGNVGVLSRYGIQAKQGASEAETLNNVLTALESRFSGLAASKINTFSGATAQLKNSFSDVLEEIGTLIIKNPVVISLIKEANTSFIDAANSVKEFGKTFNIIQDLVNPLSEFAGMLITYVIAPIEFVANYVTASFKFIATSLNGVVAGIGFAGEKLADFLNVLGVDNDLTKGLQQFGETSKQVFTESAANADQAIKSILDFPVSTALATQNEEIRLKLEERNIIAKQKNQELNTAVADGAKGLGFIFSSVIDQNSFFTDKTAKQTTRSLEETNKATTEFAKKVGQSVQQGIGVAAGNAFAAFGKALVDGENAMGAFADAFIQSIGQIAVQQGTAFILQGLAYSFIPGPSQAMAGGLIAAGAALATFGGVLSAVSGGGKKSAVGGGGIGMSADTQVFSSPQETLSQPEEIAARSESGPRVQLIVQGDIFNTEETGNRLIDILNSNFENKGNSFNNARFA